MISLTRWCRKPTIEASSCGCFAYLGYGGGEDGFFRDMKASGKESLRSYGRFVGKRFKDLPNIVWVMGGDFTPNSDDQWVVAEVAEGIHQEDSTHLISGHGSPENSAVVAFGERKWLTVNSVYSYEKTLFWPVQAEYQRRPIRPFVLIESTYEGEHNSTPDQIRRQAYWAVLGGGCGQFLGNNPIWHYDGPGLFPTKTNWQEALMEPRHATWLGCEICSWGYRGIGSHRTRTTSSLRMAMARESIRP